MRSARSTENPSLVGRRAIATIAKSNRFQGSLKKAQPIDDQLGQDFDDEHSKGERGRSPSGAAPAAAMAAGDVSRPITTALTMINPMMRVAGKIRLDDIFQPVGQVSPQTLSLVHAGWI